MNKTLVAKQLVSLVKRLVAKTFPTDFNFNKKQYVSNGDKEIHPKHKMEGKPYHANNDKSDVIYLLENGKILDEEGNIIGRNKFAKEVAAGYDAVDFIENMKSVYEKLNDGYVYLKNLQKLDNAKDENAIRALRSAKGLVSDFPHIVKDIENLLSKKA